MNHEPMKTGPSTLSRRLALALVLLLAAGLLPAGALAEPQGEERASPQDAPGELVREGLEKLMRALEAFIDAVPQYELPELNERGDIIIRRKNPAAEPDEPAKRDPDSGPLDTRI